MRKAAVRQRRTRVGLSPRMLGVLVFLSASVCCAQSQSKNFPAVNVGNTTLPAAGPVEHSESNKGAKLPIAIKDEAAFFAALDLDRPDLSAVKNAVQTQDWDAAKQAWAKHLQDRTTPQWSWSVRDKAAILQLLEARGETFAKNISAADDVLARRFNPQGVPYQLSEHINWILPHSEETHVLSRFAYFRDMGLAYWKTGDEKYPQDFVRILKDWLTDNPVPDDLSRVTKAGQPWRSLEAGIRVVNWWEDMQLFMDSPSFGAEAKYLMTKSLMEHARYLYDWTPKFRGGNWQVSEAGGVAIMGIMLPEAKESAAWRERGFARLTEHMQNDVLPDGGHSELIPSYHQWVMNQFTLIAQLCKRNGYDVPGITARHEKMFEWLMSLSQPDRCAPPIGDTHAGINIQDDMATGALLYDRPDMRFLGSKTGPASWVWLFGSDAFANYDKIKSQSPDFTSVLLPNSKYIVMRSGWDAAAKYLFFDLAPGGAGHKHQDRLQIILYAGRALLIDPGIYSYNQPLSETYFRFAEAHNMLLIDGKASPRTADVACYPKLLAYQSNAQRDFASGSTQFDGFEHQRSVLFIKPDYWIVTDHVSGPGTHEITRLFHFPLGPSAADGNVARTAFATGENLQVRVADGAKLEFGKGWIPVGGAKAEQAPVASYTLHGALPMTLVTVLTPFADPKETPTVETLADVSAAVAHVRLTFPDGQQDEIEVATAPTSLAIGAQTAQARVLVVRHGPRSNSVFNVP